MSETPARIAESIRTAQSIAHHRLAEMGDDSHAGVPRECHRPLCRRLLQDAEAVDAMLGDPTPVVPLPEGSPFCLAPQS